MKKDRKNGMFQVQVYFGEHSKKQMVYTPSEEDIKTQLESILDEMVKAVSEVTRIVDHTNYDSVMKKKSIP
jgi:hypothetical protein